MGDVSTVDLCTREDPAFKAEEAVAIKRMTDQAKALYPFFKPAAPFTLATEVNVLLLLLLLLLFFFFINIIYFVVCRFQVFESAILNDLPDILKGAINNYIKSLEGVCEITTLVDKIAGGLKYSDPLADKACDGDFSIIESLPDYLKKAIVEKFKSFNEDDDEVGITAEDTKCILSLLVHKHGIDLANTKVVVVEKVHGELKVSCVIETAPDTTTVASPTTSE